MCVSANNTYSFKDKKEEDSISGVDIVTQYPNSKGELESAGLLKMDFLGLQTLSIIDVYKRQTFDIRII